MTPGRPARLAAGLLVALVTASCASSAARARGSEEVLRLGVFPTLTHAPAHAGLAAGIFRSELGPTRVEVTTFNSGSDAGTALLAGEIDATYIGPGPAQQLYLRSGKVAVVSGAVVGGAGLVVANGSGIEEPADLDGAKVAVPSIGNSQDIALRTWLHEHGLRARDEGGSVLILPVDSGELEQLFRTGQVQAAWEPEPWTSVLVSEGLARRFVDEADLWPGGRFVTASLMVSTGYLRAHPEVVERLVRANVESILLLQEDPARAKALVMERLRDSGVPRLTPRLLEEAWPTLTFDWDPQVEAFLTQAAQARELGYLDADPSAILPIYRLDILNGVLEEMGLPTVEEPG